MSHTYKYPRPSVTVDTAIVTTPSEKQEAQLLLIQRKNTPCKGMWALPGGFCEDNESLDVAAARELQEETSVDSSRIRMIQVGAFGDAGRDPRGWTITVAFAALVPADIDGVKAADDAAEAEWFDITSLPELAFDHKLVVRTAFEKLSADDSTTAAGTDLKKQLLRAAEKLQGPWSAPTE